MVLKVLYILVVNINLTVSNQEQSVFPFEGKKIQLYYRITAAEVGHLIARESPGKSGGRWRLTDVQELLDRKIGHRSEPLVQQEHNSSHQRPVHHTAFDQQSGAY